MNHIFGWVAVMISVIYGALTSFAGFSQTKEKRIQIWAAWGLVLCGALVISAGIMTLLDSPSALWILIVGLFGIHVLALNNGVKLFGKINPSHHLARLIVSVVLVILTYFGLE
jgi:hypothetical protein